MTEHRYPIWPFALIALIGLAFTLKAIIAP